ncbi:MAG: ABC transporter permease [Acidobacteria bacterium]|nr:MAG: ABC transporter permease [Acidobacteriota bacterium]
MSVQERSSGLRPAPRDNWERYTGDLRLAGQNLIQQKIRTALTALGMIFGVGAVIGMLAIGAGARQQSIEMIARMGLNNLLVNSIPSTSEAQLQQRRQLSHGLDDSDMRVLQADVPGVQWVSARREMRPHDLLPAPNGPLPDVLGVAPPYVQIHGLRLAQGRFFDATDEQAAAADCVLGAAAKVALFGYGRALGKYLKFNNAWWRVIGVLLPQPQLPGSGGSDLNGAIYTPLSAFQYRVWDADFSFKDPLDGIDLALHPGTSVTAAATVARAILTSTHHGVSDFHVVVPAALMAEQRSQQRIFTLVMVAIAAISLLVGGIGIMNIVLATVLERTREIGVRRATGATRGDILRQFLIESVLISFSGGAIGVLFGVALSRAISWAAGWPTVVSALSIVVAFGVSVVVGIVFGLYPARKASLISPIDALRYE